MLACESRTCRRTMEVLGKDDKHSFLMKYPVFSGAIPLQSQAGVKVQSCLKRAANHVAQPVHFDDKTPETH